MSTHEATAPAPHLAEKTRKPAWQRPVFEDVPLGFEVTMYAGAETDGF